MTYHPDDDVDAALGCALLFLATLAFWCIVFAIALWMWF